MLNWPKEMNAIPTKVVLQIFPRVCPFDPSIFPQLTPKHVFPRVCPFAPSIIFSSDTKTRFALLTSHNMPSNMLHTLLYPKHAQNVHYMDPKDA
jgi:hypothetical protein